MRRQRIVKPRSQKQRETAHRYSHSLATALLIIPKGNGLPTRSWWTEAPRENFTAAARAEAERMRLSMMFGSITTTRMMHDEANG